MSTAARAPGAAGIASSRPRDSSGKVRTSAPTRNGARSSAARQAAKVSPVTCGSGVAAPRPRRPAWSRTSTTAISTSEMVREVMVYGRASGRRSTRVSTEAIFKPPSLPALPAREEPAQARPAQKVLQQILVGAGHRQEADPAAVEVAIQGVVAHLARGPDALARAGQRELEPYGRLRRELGA